MIIAVTNSGLCPGEIKRLGWSFLVEHPSRAVPAALTTLYQPNYMDILPIFIWSMAAMPAFAWLEHRFGIWALVPSVALYLAAWLGGLTPPSLGPDTTIGFNPLAWQILFMLGAYLGRRMLLLGSAVPPSRALTAAAVLVLLAGLILRLSWFGWLPFDLGVPENAWLIGKDELALPRMIHALALALIVARLAAARGALDASRAGSLARRHRPPQPARLLSRPVPVLGRYRRVPLLAAGDDAARSPADPGRLRDPAVVRHVARPGTRRRTIDAEIEPAGEVRDQPGHGGTARMTRNADIHQRPPRRT